MRPAHRRTSPLADSASRHRGAASWRRCGAEDTPRGARFQRRARKFAAPTDAPPSCTRRKASSVRSLSMAAGSRLKSRAQSCAPTRSTRWRRAVRAALASRAVRLGRQWPSPRAGGPRRARRAGHLLRVAHERRLVVRAEAWPPRGLGVPLEQEQRECDDDYVRGSDRVIAASRARNEIADALPFDEPVDEGRAIGRKPRNRRDWLAPLHAMALSRTLSRSSRAPRSWKSLAGQLWSRARVHRRAA